MFWSDMVRIWSRMRLISEYLGPSPAPFYPAWTPLVWAPHPVSVFPDSITKAFP